MRPLRFSELHTRVEKKSVLILDLTRLYLHSIEDLAPANISSKKGNKKLPLEIWYQIFDLAAGHDKSHRYYLVQPRSIKQNKTGSMTVACALVRRWKACGSIDNADDVEIYERYLVRPHRREQNEGDRPFHLPDNEATVHLVPTAALGKRILFEKITVPDVISWVERERCTLCDGERMFCAGCGKGIEVADYWTLLGYEGDCSITIPCSLCLGLDFAGNSIYKQMALKREHDRNGVVDERKYKEYEAWADGRCIELGYK